MMKNTVFLFCLMTLLPLHAVNYDVVPRPQLVTMQQGEPFVLNSSVQILADAGLQQEAGFLQSYLQELTGYLLPVSQKREKKVSYIELALSPKVQGAEGYCLMVNQKRVAIVGNTAAGVFYGIQTLRKALADEQQTKGGSVLLSAVTVVDAPRFSYRGMHLDCSRHFFSVDFVKKYIDLLALHNMNVFHWHLTDDQGWRIEIKQWPKLVSVGSQRSGTIIGTNSDLDDHTPYGGYYTQQEARDIVAYAKARHITVIPEIDMPGHMLAALASYPELGCTGGPYEVGHYWGVYKDVLCVANERVYQFVQDVLTEVMDIFPSEVIHIGGDEAPTDKWLQCPKCRKLPSLQPYFTRRVFDFLAARHRRAMGWDEILDDSPQNAMIMSWRGTEPGATAAAAGWRLPHTAISTISRWKTHSLNPAVVGDSSLSIRCMPWSRNLTACRLRPRHISSVYRPTFGRNMSLTRTWQSIRCCPACRHWQKCSGHNLRARTTRLSFSTSPA